MHDFGVQAPELKATARTPDLPSTTRRKSVPLDSTRSPAVVLWEGAKVRNVVGLDEVSAAGTPGETGVTVLEVPQASPAGKAGLTPGDVILAFNNRPVNDAQDLLWYTRQARGETHASITILRYQQEST